MALRLRQGIIEFGKLRPELRELAYASNDGPNNCIGSTTNLQQHNDNPKASNFRQTSVVDSSAAFGYMHSECFKTKTTPDPMALITSKRLSSRQTIK